MSEKLKLHWNTPIHDLPGNALGYNQHNSMMKKFGEEYFEYDDTADIALSIVPADFFKPVPGKLNVLFTMWESLDIPNNYLQRICRADVLVVPCQFCHDLFRPYFKGPIYICQEGVDASKYPFFQRHMPLGGDKFRILWVGAANPRKGYPVMMELIKALEKFTEIEIYLKTTTAKGDRKSYVTKLWQQRRKLKAQDAAMYRQMLVNAKNPDVSDQVVRGGKHNNVVWDSRKLPQDILTALYNSAHLFVFPTYGEGWGLTLCEAMATGLPCVATNATGVKDFFDSRVGYPIPYEVREQEFSNYYIISRIFCPSVNETLKSIIHVINNYKNALYIGKNASKRIHSRFTWNIAAQRLNEIISEIKHGGVKCSKEFAAV